MYTDLVFAFKCCEFSWFLPFTRHTNFSEIKSSQKYLQETPNQHYCSTWWIKDVNFHQVLSRWAYHFRIFISLSPSAWVEKCLCCCRTICIHDLFRILMLFTINTSADNALFRKDVQPKMLGFCPSAKLMIHSGKS